MLSCSRLLYKHASVPRHELAHDFSNHLCSKTVFRTADRSACCLFPACECFSGVWSNSFSIETFYGRYNKTRWSSPLCHVPLSCGCRVDSWKFEIQYVHITIFPSLKYWEGSMTNLLVKLTGVSCKWQTMLLFLISAPCQLYYITCSDGWAWSTLI